MQTFLLTRTLLVQHPCVVQVVLDNLTPRTRYFYKVKGGSPSCTWSSVFSFRSPYSSTDVADPKTKVAIFGDMGTLFLIAATAAAAAHAVQMLCCTRARQFTSERPR